MNSLSSKPFKAKTFYLDLTSYPHSSKLVKDLESLGAKEVFSIPSASFVVSDRAGIKSESNPSTPFSLSRSNSPNLFRGSPLDSLFSPSVNSPSHDQKYPMERLKPISRGMSMMLKANEKTQGMTNKRDILDICKKWKVKVYPVQKVLHYIEKYKSKLLKIQQTKKKHEISTKVLHKITPPFIKMEDAERKFKPRYKTLTSKVTDSWLFKSVRMLVRNSKHSRDSDNFVRPVFKEISVKSQTVSKNESSRTEMASVTKAPCCNSVSNSVSVCVPTNALKEEKENQSHVNAAKKGKKKSKKLYCEICHTFYSDSDDHYEKDSHKKFLENLENYEQVQAIISTLPSLDDFIAKNKAEEEGPKETSFEKVHLFEGPISMGSKSNDETDCYVKMSSNVDSDACLTERYTVVNFNEYISETCSTPSASLPFLESHEFQKTTGNVGPPTVVYYSQVNDSSNVFSTQNVLSKPPEIIQFNGADINPCMCSFSDVCGTCPNCITNSKVNITYDLYNTQSCNDNNLTNDLINFSKTPFLGVSIDALDYSKENLSLLEQNLALVENLNLMQGNSAESSIGPIDLSLNQKVLTNMTETADASISKDSAIDVSNSLLDMTKTSIDDDSHCLIDMTKISTENDSAYSTVGTAKMTSDELNLNYSLVNSTNITFNFDCPKPVSLHVDTSTAGQLHESKNEINNDDCDTEIYNSDSDSDDNLNKIVEDCIEEVDKNLEADVLGQPANTDICIDSTTPKVVSEKSFNNSSTSIVPESSFEKVINVIGDNSVCATGSTQFEMHGNSSKSSHLQKLGKHTIPAVSPPSKRKCTETHIFLSEQFKNQSVETPEADIDNNTNYDISNMQNGCPMINKRQIELPYLDKLCAKFTKVSSNLVSELGDSPTENLNCPGKLPKLSQSKIITELSSNFILPENLNMFSDGNSYDVPFEIPPTLSKVCEEQIKPSDETLLDKPPLLEPAVFCSASELATSTLALFSNDLKPTTTVSTSPVLPDSNKLNTITVIDENNFITASENISIPSKMSNFEPSSYLLFQDIHLLNQRDFSANNDIPCDSENHSCNSIKDIIFKFPSLNSDDVENCNDKVTKNIQRLKEASILPEAFDSEDIYIVLDEVEDAKSQADTNESWCSLNEIKGILDNEQENYMERINPENCKFMVNKIKQSADFHTHYTMMKTNQDKNTGLQEIQFVKESTRMDLKESYANYEIPQDEVKCLAHIIEQTKVIVDVINHIVTVVSNNITEHKENLHETVQDFSCSISESTENEFYEREIKSLKTCEKLGNLKQSEKVDDTDKLLTPSKILKTHLKRKICDTISSEIAVSSQSKKRKQLNQADVLQEQFCNEMSFEATKSFTPHVVTISTVGFKNSMTINDTDSSGIACHTYNHSGINRSLSFEGDNSLNDSLNSSFQNDKSYYDSSCENVSHSSGSIDSPSITMNYNCANFETPSDKKEKPAQIVYLNSPKPCHDVCV